MNKDKLLEGFGFLFEINCFFLAGVFLFINFYISISLYIVGVVLAILVGKQIIKNNVSQKIQ